MKYSFRKGKHRPTFSFPWLHTGKDKSITVTFSPSAWYKDPDWERDWNKLYGWSYGFLPKKVAGKWVPAHHYESDRLVHRPSLTEGFMEIGTYSYIKGHIDYSNIVLLGEYEVGLPFTITYPSEPEWGYMLSPFHGGTNPSPQDYTITIT